MAGQLKSRYDIIINGGGIVGFTLLNLILKSRHLSRSKVLLIEQAPKPIKSEEGDLSQEEEVERKFSNRVSSITSTSKNCLETLGVWGNIKRYAKDVKSIKVWNYDYSNKIIFDNKSSSLQSHELMFSVVENDRLSAAILNNIDKQADPTTNGIIAWNHSLKDLKQPQDSRNLINVVLENKSHDEELVVSAPLLLGCDGFKSKVRDFAQMKYREIDLNQKAVVGTVRMSPIISSQPSDNSVAFQRFSADKNTVAALLPLDGQYSSFVISAPNNYAKHLLECDDDSFVSEFNQLLSKSEVSENLVLSSLHHFANFSCRSLNDLFQSIPALAPRGAGTFEYPNEEGYESPPSVEMVVKDSRAGFPLVFGTTTPQMVARLSPGNQHNQIALLGDSSHRVHPLAGQGLNLGIQDAIELVRQLEAAASRGERIFDDLDQYALDRALKRYECKRQAYIVPMSAAILSMPHLFKLMPSGCVSSVNKCDIIKSASMRIANGL